MGFPLGKEGDAGPSRVTDEQEVVGLEFVADEELVSHLQLIG